MRKPRRPALPARTVRLRFTALYGGLFLLSGFVYSIETMPTIIQVITHVIPARYVVTIMKGVFLKGVGLEVLWGELGFLGLYAAIIFLLAVRKMNRKLA